MDQLLEWFSGSKLLLVGGVLSAIIGVVARKVPKKKLMGLVPDKTPKIDKMVFGFGLAMSVFLMAKIGKRATESLEEGILQTVIATLMSWTTRACNTLIRWQIEFGKGFMSDNMEVNNGSKK